MIKVQFGPVLDNVIREFDAFSMEVKDGWLELVAPNDDIVVAIGPGYWIYAEDLDPDPSEN